MKPPGYRQTYDKEKSCESCIHISPCVARPLKYFCNKELAIVSPEYICDAYENKKTKEPE